MPSENKHTEEYQTFEDNKWSSDFAAGSSSMFCVCLYPVMYVSNSPLTPEEKSLIVLDDLLQKLIFFSDLQ